MAQVVVRVNDRPYTLQCGDGEEEHLAELAQLIDREVTKLKHSVGQVGDSRLLLMAGLVITDQLAEALQRIEDLQEQLDGQGGGSRDEPRGPSVEDRVAERLTAAAAKLEALSRNLNSRGDASS
ncbi:cell division protein ZapA [Kaustia mangrovi]|uniref:Cell division protein ZapA n=1 Tax=Kaustia mangrovi TaxID=2593653 RepID=A0A7S8HCY3_9HYPH|nr:cell division protein ZapA [Kaustia mangrovi]QPC43934.1 cell division protein ZapA [Kaustia mangrovi]